MVNISFTPQAIGSGGIGVKKTEGDGITPLGKFHLLEVLYRPDRVKKPTTSLPLYPIEPTMLWVDDPASPDYNKRIMAGHYSFSHEKLWRDDNLYDLLVVLDYNINPIIKGRGSAIFIHLPPLKQAGDERAMGVTAGCVGLSAPDIYRLVAIATPQSQFHITHESCYIIA